MNTKSVKILALGDSLTAGYGLPQDKSLVPQLNDWLKSQSSNIIVLNGGVSGDTTAGGAARLGWILTPEVDAMIVTLGGNDLLRGIPPKETHRNIESILQQAKERSIPVLLIGMKAPTNLGPEYKQHFDKLYPELAESYNTLYIDSFFDLIYPNAKTTSDFLQYMQADGIHPNALGVKQIVSRLGPDIEALAHVVKEKKH